MQINLPVLKIFFLIALGFYSNSSIAANFTGAPAAFSFQQSMAVPIDIQRQTLSLQFDPKLNTARGHSKIEFETSEEGFPFFDIVPDPDQVILDGVALPSQTLSLYHEPKSAAAFRILLEAIKPGILHTLEVDYALSPDTYEMSQSGEAWSEFGFDDLDERGFLEIIGIGNFEFDTFDLNVEIQINSNEFHQLFANGRVSSVANNHWKIQFPHYFSSSSPFIHFSASQLSVLRENIGSIPVTLYSEDPASVREAWEITKKQFALNQATFGPYAHEQFIGYINKHNGGMEYCGATETEVSALAHEINHSWFARGVMPADGNSGWIDEAISMWIGTNFYRAVHRPEGDPVKLINRTVYYRETNRAAYSDGLAFLEELDFDLVRSGFQEGLRAVLKSLYQNYTLQRITNQTFIDEIKKVSGIDYTNDFKKYVYGQKTF